MQNNWKFGCYFISSSFSKQKMLMTIRPLKAVHYNWSSYEHHKKVDFLPQVLPLLILFHSQLLVLLKGSEESGEEWKMKGRVNEASANKLGWTSNIKLPPFIYIEAVVKTLHILILKFALPCSAVVSALNFRWFYDLEDGGYTSLL